MACFGSTKNSTEQQQQQQQTVTASPNEQELQKLQLNQAQTLMPYQTEAAKQAYGITGDILSSPDLLSKLFAGISPEITADIASESIKDILPSFQKSGILDSGVAASIAARTAGDVRRQSAEYNLTNLFNLLQTGLGYGGQQQQLTQSGTSSLASSLAGLRSIQSTGTTSMTTRSNPFLESFYTSSGKTLGSPKFSIGPFAIGG